MGKRSKEHNEFKSQLGSRGCINGGGNGTLWGQLCMACSGGLGLSTCDELKWCRDITKSAIKKQNSSDLTWLKYGLFEDVNTGRFKEIFVGIDWIQIRPNLFLLERSRFFVPSSTAWACWWQWCGAIPPYWPGDPRSLAPMAGTGPVWIIESYMRVGEKTVKNEQGEI